MTEGQGETALDLGASGWEWCVCFQAASLHEGICIWNGPWRVDMGKMVGKAVEVGKVRYSQRKGNHSVRLE